MQSIEAGPVPTQVELSVHWLPFGARLIDNALFDVLMTALDAMSMIAHKMTGILNIRMRKKGERPRAILCEWLS